MALEDKEWRDKWEVLKALTSSAKGFSALGEAMSQRGKLMEGHSLTNSWPLFTLCGSILATLDSHR